MPPTEVRPQTFNSLQSYDSDSPSVRFQTGQNTLFNLRPTGLYKPLPCQLTPVCQLFCAVAKYANFDVRLSVPVVWVGYQPRLLYNI